ncbi:general secretion pathway protein GspK [Mesorhizobium sp. M00.F.Ca.ET.186.01.1.1]|nr:general secretion pathway protein GspK [bacterium M00.F.Ca.ET.205.01.1.1]TGU53773.1 general secretion pathway protein GspK [bacterium M00.F.Ca.ET.152.01.1.1]TGV37271.1 general secretion pathway protein GspK [Mesorhizobium sp. M00.F.Ca.ET.186.01.1.1]TGZ39358.1 general secretion pathway protein GspK [bacterium M00.F.Ca.ET.162.01.1.1]TIW61225.1 MAG: general secretion pathway protein GspK [Mesorhizobium sp.]
MASDPTDDGNEGFGLVAVLVFMLIVSAVVAPFALTARTRLMIAGNEMEHERLSMVADGLVNVVASELFDGSAAQKLPQNAEPARCHSGQFSFDLTVQDHSGLIDLNAASDQLLTQGVASFGFPPQMAEEIAKAIVTFRGPPNAFAAGTQPQSSLGPRQNKFAPFESVSELQEFSALASIPLRDLYGAFTVDLKQGSIVLAKAPKRLRTLVTGTSPNGQQDGQQENSGGTVYTIEVTARRDGSGITGQAGMVVEKSALIDTGFRRVSSMPAAEIGAAGSTASVPTIACDRLFGSAVAQILARWS